MNMVQFMLHVLMLEREMETYQQEHILNYGMDNITESKRKPKKKRFNWFFDRLDRVKLVIAPSERVVANQCSCQAKKRTLETVASQCSPLRSGGSK